MRCEFDDRGRRHLPDHRDRHRRQPGTRTARSSRSGCSGGVRPAGPQRRTGARSRSSPIGETYAPGDTAELLVQAPFAPAYGIVTIIQHGIVSTEAFDAEDGSAVIEIPIEDERHPQHRPSRSTWSARHSHRRRRHARSPTCRHSRRSRPDTIDLLDPAGHPGPRRRGDPAADAVEPGDDTRSRSPSTDADGEPVERRRRRRRGRRRGGARPHRVRARRPARRLLPDRLVDVDSEYIRSSILARPPTSSTTTRRAIGHRRGDARRRRDADRRRGRRRRGVRRRLRRRPAGRPAPVDADRAPDRTSTPSRSTHPTSRPAPTAPSPSTCRSPTT